MNILGSSILDLIIVDILDREGLSCDISTQEKLTNEQSLMVYSTKNNPEEFLSNLESLYSENGFDACLSWFRTNCKHSMMQLYNGKINSNWKNTLQEYLQSYGEKVPQYRVKTKKGSKHRPTLIVEVLYRANNEDYIFEGKGPSKKIASMNAAKEAYNKVFLI